MRWVLSMLGVTVAIIVTSIAFWVVGAFTAQLFSPGIGGALASALAAAIVTLVVPILVDLRLTDAFRKVDPSARSTAFQTLFALNLIFACIAFAAFPRQARAALEQRGEWALAGDPARPGSLQRALLLVTPHLPRSADEAPPAPPANALRASASAPLAASAPTAPAPRPPAAPGASAAAAPVRGPAARVFEQRAPSVVVIRTRALPNKGALFGELLGRLGIKLIDSMGSGFAIEHANSGSETLIVTNRHVIAGAKMIEIAVRDGRRFERVERLVQDARNDLALLRASGLSLPPIPITSSEPVPGDRAIAIGSPLGLEYTLTDGIVSAGREIEGTRFIQMQTEIAPGSSGGPLLDEHGALLGVNTAGREGANLNLAVDRRHVRALLEKPRAPFAYERFRRGPEITAIEYSGFDPDATDRMQARELFAMLGVSLDGCVENAAPGARVRKVLPHVGTAFRSAAPVGEGVPPSALECLRMPLELVGLQLGILLADETEPAAAGQERSAIARFTLPPNADASADAASLSVEFHAQPDAAP